MPTMIDASSMDEKSQQIYLCQMQIQESTIKLGRTDLGKGRWNFVTAGQESIW